MIKEYQNLANAIVLQAITDYEHALFALCTDFTSLCHTEGDRKEVQLLKQDAVRSIKECESFFKSKWYQCLTMVDAECFTEVIKSKILNADMVRYDPVKKEYLCTCGCRLNTSRPQKWGTFTKCRDCKKYWRVRGEPIEEMEDEA